MAEKQEVLVLKGLATQPNEYGELPPGTLSKAENLTIRRPGAYEPLASTVTLGVNTTGAMVCRAFGAPQLGQTIIVGGADSDNITSARWLPSDSEYATTDITYGSITRNVFFPQCETRLTINRDRYIMTESNGPLISDIYLTPARLVGIVPPTALDFGTPVDLSGTADLGIADGNYVTYCAVFRWEYPDGYIFRGAPSPALIFLNASGFNAGVPVKVLWSSEIAANITPAATYVEIYRASQDPDLEAIDQEFALVAQHAITNADISAGQTTVLDTCAEDAKGASLYTNQFQNGAEGANFMPPKCKDVVTYKGVTFYSNIREWTQKTFTLTGQVGNLLGSNSAYSLGQRRLTVNVTNGSAVVVYSTGTDPLTPIGLYAGQIVSSSVPSGGFAAGTKVLSFTGTTITFNNPWTGATAASIEVFTNDIVTINGTDHLIGSEGAGRLQQSLALLNAPLVLYTESVNVSDSTLSPVPGGDWLFIRPIPDGRAISMTMTNPQAWGVDLVPITFAYPLRTNRAFFSREQQPEAVPPLNFFDIGQGVIYRLVPTESAIWAYCSDGIYRVTTDGVTVRVDAVDQSSILIHPDAIDYMNGTTYAWLTGGFCRIDDGAVTSLSNIIKGDVQTAWDSLKAVSVLISVPVFRLGTFVTCDPFHNEVWFTIGHINGNIGTRTTYQKYLFNADTGEFTTPTVTPQQMVYNAATLKIIAVSGTDLSTFTSTTAGVVSARLNPLWGSRLGDLKQWMSVVLSWGDVDINFRPAFTDSVVVAAGSVTGQKSYVVPVPRRVALNKQLEFGFDTSAGSGRALTFTLLGITVRVRTASETLKR